jgi:hypothetical protein
VRSQAMTVQLDSTSEHSFDERYVGTKRERPDSEIQSATETGTLQMRGPVYISVGSETAYSREVKEKQVGWWVGRVESVKEDYFTAVLEDLQSRTSIAEFDKEEVTPSDLSLLVPNARFTFTVMQVDKHSGREYISKISLSGPAVWTEKDFERARESYEKLFPAECFSF